MSSSHSVWKQEVGYSPPPWPLTWINSLASREESMPEKGALTAPKSNFRFTAESGLRSDIAPCPKSATNGLMRRSKRHLQSPILTAQEQACFEIGRASCRERV